MVTFRRLADSQKIEIIEKYQTGKFTCHQLATQYNMSDGSIRGLLKRRGIPITKHPNSKIKSQKIIREKQPKDYKIGDKIYRWTILEVFPGSKTEHVKWKCQCSCEQATIRKIQAINIVDGRSKSCGCFKKEVQQNCIYIDKKSSGEVASKIVFCNYKQGSVKRGLDFQLSLEDFLYITNQKCFYCGIEKSNVSNPKKANGSLATTGPFEYNGIDRVNNDIGYIKDNCVPCCFQCNHAKSVHSQKDFIKWLDTAYHNLETKGFYKTGVWDKENDTSYLSSV